MYSNKIMKHIDLSLPEKLFPTKIDLSIGRGHIEFSSLKLEFEVSEKECAHKQRLVLKNVTKSKCFVSFDPKAFTSSQSFSILDMRKDGLYVIEPQMDIALHASIL